MRPFVLKSASQFQTAGPNKLDSAQWVADYIEVKGIGSLNSATRTGDQTHNALFWQSNGGPAYLWNGTARSLVAGMDTSAADDQMLTGRCHQDPAVSGDRLPRTCVHHAVVGLAIEPFRKRGGERLVNMEQDQHGNRRWSG